jgi:hypothetical protein
VGGIAAARLSRAVAEKQGIAVASAADEAAARSLKVILRRVLTSLAWSQVARSVAASPPGQERGGHGQ